jgi:hypothetical protein
MDFYYENAKKLPVTYDVEVLVLGGGPAGFSAAVNAARHGARTLLIEETGDVGGVATTGLMSHWTGNSFGGFYEEILDRSSDVPEDKTSTGLNGGGRQIINTEKLKTEMLEMLLEAGVKPLLYTSAVDVIMNNDSIEGVIIENSDGRQAVKAKITIDATGDGDIAVRAGADFKMGRGNDRRMQPVTLMFKIGGVDYESAVFPGCFEDNLKIPRGYVQDIGKKNLPEPAGHVLLYKTTIPGVVTCNMTNCTNIDGTNTEDLTKATVECRRQMDKIVDFLREFVPGYENCYLLTSASVIGVRETRHFTGEYVLNEEDIKEARIFEDWIVANAHFNFDVHNITGSGLDDTGCQKNFSQIKGYTIPYRCFVPVKIDNLYLAGRNISGTHIAHSNYRVMPICANMGHGVGIAAALCIKYGVAPRRLNVSLVQQILEKEGVRP